MRNSNSTIRLYSALAVVGGFVPIVAGGLMRGDTGYPFIGIGVVLIIAGFFGFAFGRMADD